MFRITVVALLVLTAFFFLLFKYEEIKNSKKRVNKRIVNALRVILKDLEEGKNPGSFGICYCVNNLIRVNDHISLSEGISTWKNPERDESNVYPIPVAYERDGIWVGKARELRKDLVIHLIKYYSGEVV